MLLAYCVSFFHLGRAIWTKHVRNGKELPEIARDNHYDFNFQVLSIEYGILFYYNSILL